MSEEKHKDEDLDRVVEHYMNAEKAKRDEGPYAEMGKKLVKLPFQKEDKKSNDRPIWEMFVVMVFGFGAIIWAIIGTLQLAGSGGIGGLVGTVIVLSITIFGLFVGLRKVVEKWDK